MPRYLVSFEYNDDELENADLASKADIMDAVEAMIQSFKDQNDSMRMLTIESLQVIRLS